MSETKKRTPGKTGGRTAGGAKTGQRTGKPAGSRPGERRFSGKPAGSASGERKPSVKPAGAGNGERRLSPRPAGSASGERKFPSKPAGAGNGERRLRPGSTGNRTGERFGRGPSGRPAEAVRPKPAGRGKPGEIEGIAARRAALKVLREVTEDGAYASLSLDRVLRGSGLSGADRRLSSRLVYDTLDHLIQLDYMLSQVMAREDTDIKLRNILRLGACQMLLEDRIPESAATNTCVQLCTETGMEGLKGVCNGILRNLARKKEELRMPDPETEPEKYFSVKYSVPEWLGTRLKADWGEEEAVRILSFRNTDSAITLRRNLLRTDEAGFERILEKKVWGREKGDLPGAWRITGAMDIARDADFLAGAFSIQSESSMMVCLAAAPRRGSQVLDCCAAPGGKACYLSELMGDTGRVQAWDIHEHRVDLISAQQKRLGIENIRPIQRDALKYREDLDSRMDTVLLDAPCSGLGVLAEKPDILLRVTEESIRELTEIQAGLLKTVSRYVRPGGTLVYSTCSVLKAENEDQIRAFLETHPDFTAEKLPETIPEKFRQYEELGLQLMPHRDGVEGFYLCRMRRKAEI